MSLTDDPIIETDLLIIGGGLAGAFAAIKAREAGISKVILIDKAKSGKSGCSAFAAGVMQVFVPEEDNFDFWFSEIVERGCYLQDQEFLQVILNEALTRVKEMEQYGVTFEKTQDGKFERRNMRGGVEAKPIKAIMFHGPQLMEAMRKKVIRSGINVIDRIMITDLLTRDNRVVGAVGFDAINGDFKIFKSRCVILTCGGNGYKKQFAGHRMVSGDGTAMAYRAGAKLKCLDITAFHSSARNFDMLGMNMIVTLGGAFINAKGERFLHEYDPVLGDHTLMETYTQAMALEVTAGRGPIYMDMTSFTPDDVSKMRVVIPLACKILEGMGVLVGNKIIKRVEWIAFLMGSIGGGGGVDIDRNCACTIDGLYAAGDTANRRGRGASHSGAADAALPFAAVSGAIAGKSAAEYIKGAGDTKLDESQIQELKAAAMAPLNRKRGVEPDQVVLSLQEAILPKEISIILDGMRLQKALKEVNEIALTQVPLLVAYDPHYLRMAQEAQNMVLCAQMWLRSIIERKESRGAILREDYPETDNINWLKWITLQMGKDGMEIGTEDVPIERYPLQPTREKFLHPMWQVAERRDIKWG